MKILAVELTQMISKFLCMVFKCCRDRGDQIFLGIATDGSAGGENKGLELSKREKMKQQKPL